MPQQPRATKAARPRIFVTQPVSEQALKRLRAVARVTINADSRRIISKRTLIAQLRKADILFCLLHDKIDRAVIAANPDLRLIAAQSITPSNIDVAAATARRIPVTVTAPITTEATADLTFGLMLAVARRMIEGDRLARAAVFPGSQSAYLMGSYVWGKTLGLVGGGGLIGKAVARRAHGFGMHVLYWTPRRKPAKEEREAGLVYAPFEQLLHESDFVSLHSPLNDENAASDFRARTRPDEKDRGPYQYRARTDRRRSRAGCARCKTSRSRAPASTCSNTSRRSTRRSPKWPTWC